jgi:hypothetical protein
MKLKVILLLSVVWLAFGACNNEPPECGLDPFPPLRCELKQLSGKKIDSLFVYHYGLDSMLGVYASLPSSLTLPLNINGDTTFVQFTIVGKTQTAVERYSSILGVYSTPELCIINVDCGPVYIYRDLDYTFYSVINYQPVYQIDTVRETYKDSVYTYIDKRKVSVDTVNYIMSIDSIQYFTTDVDQDYEVHARIFF